MSNGSIIGMTNPSLPVNKANGVWTLSEHFNLQKSAKWPGATAPLWSGSLIIGSVAGTNEANPGSQSGYAAVSTIPTGINYTFNSGYHYFNIGPATYTVNIRGAEGSGTQHGYGANISATLVVTTTTRLVAIVGNPGTGAYGAGGGTFLAIVSGPDDYTTATALLVAGGGGGGYSNYNAWLDAGGTTWDPLSRKGSTTETYDAGAAFGNFYAPKFYNNNNGTQGSVSAQHFVWGGRGGIQTACGGIYGGFGGGGGGCPGGGGGYYGGRAGTDSPGGTGGGGGTSYRLESGDFAYISAWSDLILNGTNRTSTSSLARGYLSITV